MVMSRIIGSDENCIPSTTKLRGSDKLWYNEVIYCYNFIDSMWVHLKLDLFYNITITITINHSWLLHLKTVEA